MNIPRQSSSLPTMRAASPSGGIRPGRGAASAKFRRTPTSGAAQEKRVAFGKQWGAFNSQAARELRGER